MEVADGQQLGPTLFEPLPCGRRLALGAMPVAAAVVRDDRVRAALAARDMPTECRRAAALDRTHDFHLVEADMPGIGATPRRSMVAEDIGDLQPHLCHSEGNRRKRFKYSYGAKAAVSRLVISHYPIQW
jgi:hypothetical protein